MKKYYKKIVAMLIATLMICNNIIYTANVKAGVYWAKEAEYVRIGDTIGYSRATYDGYINPYYFNVSSATDLSIKMYITQFDADFSVYLYNDDGDCLFADYNISKGDCKYNHSTNAYEITLNFGKLKKGTYYLELDTHSPSYENRGAFKLFENKPVIIPNNNSTTSAKNTVNKKFKISKKKIVVKKGKKKSVTVTYKYNSGSVYYKIKKKKCVSARWGDWNGDKVKLYIKGKRKGKTKIYVTNSVNSKKLVITVKVK